MSAEITRLNYTDEDGTPITLIVTGLPPEDVVQTGSGETIELLPQTATVKRGGHTIQTFSKEGALQDARDLVKSLGGKLNEGELDDRPEIATPFGIRNQADVPEPKAGPKRTEDDTPLLEESAGKSKK